jgi:hypothetical protein
MFSVFLSLPAILLSTLFSESLGLYSSLRATKQVSLPYKRTSQIISKFLDRGWEDKTS